MLCVLLNSKDVSGRLSAELMVEISHSTLHTCMPLKLSSPFGLLCFFWLVLFPSRMKDLNGCSLHREDDKAVTSVNFRSLANQRKTSE